MREKGVRYYFIDGVRGLAIINMAIFHFWYDVFNARNLSACAV